MINKIKTLKEVELKDKLVLLRVDINSPVNNKKLIDNPRLKEAAETIKYIVNKKAKLVIIAHQGRKGDADFIDLRQHAELLSKYSGKKIEYIDGLFEDSALERIDQLEMGEALIMKNVREYEDEKELRGSRFYGFADLFDLYVNDAFSVCHRNQGSIVIPPEEIESCAGLNLEKEINVLSKFDLDKNEKAVYIVGGKKIEDYMPILNVLTNKNAKIIASGVLANLFLVAKGLDLGYENKWLKEKDYMRFIPKLKDIYNKHKEQIILPVDFAIDGKERKEISLKDLPNDKKIWDVGHESVSLFIKEIEKAKIVFMKGPVGYSEIEKFSYGTVEALKCISKLTADKQIFSLLGGGHLSTSIQEYKIPNHFSHISTSGGALISYISGETLPGVQALEKSVGK
jgi:phosphoglycerate kinase